MTPNRQVLWKNVATVIGPNYASLLKKGAWVLILNEKLETFQRITLLFYVGEKLMTTANLTTVFILDPERENAAVSIQLGFLPERQVVTYAFDY
jgi:hypothetical protein